MRTWTIAMTLAFGLSATAAAQQAVAVGAPRGPVDIVLDFENRLALVPEGTIVPAGLKISGYWTKGSLLRGPSRRATSASDEFRTVAPRGEREPAPFVFAYAPDSVFEPYRTAPRKNVKGASFTVKPLTFQCYGPFNVYASNPSCPSCYLTLTHNFCTDGFSLFTPYTEYYYSDVTMAPTPAWAYTSIGSTDGYFNCSQFTNYSAEPLSCYASDLRYNTDPEIGTTVRIEAGNEYWIAGEIYGVYADATWSPYSRHQN